MCKAVLFVTLLTAVTVVSANRKLPGKATGLLVRPGDHPWGTYYEPGFGWDAFRQIDPTTQYRFYVGSDLYAPYFLPTEGTGRK